MGNFNLGAAFVTTILSFYLVIRGQKTVSGLGLLLMLAGLLGLLLNLYFYNKKHA